MITRSCLCRVLLATTLTSLVLTACTSSRDTKAEAKSGTEKTSVNATSNVVNHGIDLNCVIDHIQNPPEAFHYSYVKQSSNPVEEEADITPQSIDGSFKNSSAARPLHGVRSDPQSWQAAWSGLMGISGMSSTIAIIRNGSAIKQEGSEKVNGYDTVKYSIDTVHADAAEQGLYRIVLGQGGFEKGTAWVTSQGCPVRLVLDEELHANNGDVESVHYEVAMTRK